MNKLTYVSYDRYGESVSVCLEFGGNNMEYIVFKRGQSKEEIAQDLRMVADALEILSK